MAPTEAEIHEAKAVLGARENLVRKLHPHVFSFFRYYDTGIALIIWYILMVYLIYFSPTQIRDQFTGSSVLAHLLPFLLWAGGAALVGLVSVRRFSKAFGAAYWTTVVLAVIIGVLIAVWGRDKGDPLYIILIYGLIVPIVAVFAAEVYRRAFTYYITDMRVVMRYKLFSTKELDQRFERIEDWKIQRSFLWRLLGIGTVRAYTGTEDGKYDPNRGYDSPDECLFGVKNPEDVKRTLVDLMIDRDRLRSGGGYGAAAAQAAATAPTAASTQPAPPPPVTEYYQPAPAPIRNYERIPPSQRRQSPGPEAAGEEETEDEGGEWPSTRGASGPAQAPAAPAPRRAPEGPVDPAAGAYPAPPSEPQPRRMFPEPEGGQTEPVLVERREMRFDEGGTGGPATASRRARPSPPPTDDDDLKPSKL